MTSCFPGRSTSINLLLLDNLLECSSEQNNNCGLVLLGKYFFCCLMERQDFTKVVFLTDDQLLSHTWLIFRQMPLAYAIRTHPGISLVLLHMGVLMAFSYLHRNEVCGKWNLKKYFLWRITSWVQTVHTTAMLLPSSTMISASHSTSFLLHIFYFSILVHYCHEP